ncbi:MAG: hypothetical protein LBC51_00545 [Treponema sp.]|nr:hypothetical protein [Treponema sp.]
MSRGTADIRNILWFEHKWTVVKDYEIRFECRLFQKLEAGKALPRIGDQGIVRVRLAGSTSILWKGKRLLVEEIHIPKQGGTDSCTA